MFLYVSLHTWWLKCSTFLHCKYKQLLLSFPWFFFFNLKYLEKIFSPVESLQAQIIFPFFCRGGWKECSPYVCGVKIILNAVWLWFCRWVQFRTLQLKWINLNGESSGNASFLSRSGGRKFRFSTAPSCSHTYGLVLLSRTSLSKQ